MKQISLARVLTALTGLFIAGHVVYHVNSMFPIVGWDHKYFLTRLIDTHLHYRINGLSIQWYTSSFGGGLPGYPHPLNAQFSLPQLLTLVVNPWIAICASYFLYCLLGYLASYIFLKRSLSMSWMASTLGAALFSANGFYLEHLANGHLNFQAFPLLPIFLVCLLSPSLPIPAASAIIGLTAAIIIYSASTYPAVFIILAMLICLPLAYLIRPKAFNWGHIAQTLALGGLLALTISLSKLYAVNSFMRFFPRDMPDHYDVPLLLAPVGLFLQLFGVMRFVPLLALTGDKMMLIRNTLQTFTGSSAGLWELDLAISPVVWILLGSGLAAMLWSLATQRLKAIPRSGNFWLGLALFLFAVEISLEFTFARGIFYPNLRQLPFLRALHVNPRFGSAFIMPLAILAAYSFSRLTAAWREKRALLFFVPLNLLVMASLGAYLLLPLGSQQQRNFDISGLLEIYNQIEQGATFPIENVGDVTDQRVFDKRTSNTRPYEVLFGYDRATFRAQVVAGPARQIFAGAFNMTNPAGLVYPEVNKLTPWSRIPADEQTQLEDFLAHRQPAWQVSSGQKISNLVSLLSLAANLAILAYGLWALCNKNKLIGNFRERG